MFTAISLSVKFLRMVTTIGSTQRREETGKKEKKGIRKKKKLTLEWDKPEKVLITGGDKGMNPANKGVQVNLLTKLGLSLTEERKKKRNVDKSAR